MAKPPKRPRDTNQLAKLITDIATGQATEVDADKGKNKAAVELGKLGGAKGGKARAGALPALRRIQIAKQGARVRWKRPRQPH